MWPFIHKKNIPMHGNYNFVLVFKKKNLFHRVTEKVKCTQTNNWPCAIKTLNWLPPNAIIKASLVWR